MKLRVLPLLLLAAGCHYQVEDRSVPEEADVARLEAKLAAHPCVGPLENWERNYRYSRKTGLFSLYTVHADFNVIEFHLRRAGTITIAPGRHIMEPHPTGDWPDSNPIQSIDGKFALSGGSLSLAPCARARRRPSN